VIPEMIALIGAVSALAGVLIGGVMNYLTHRSIKKQEWRLTLTRDQLQLRQKVYAEFLVEAQRMLSLGREDKIKSLSDLDPLKGKFAEVSMFAPPEVFKAAQKLADASMTSQQTPPAKEVASFFQLKENFVAAVRADLAMVTQGA
jgi:hypothetical protein